MKKSIFLIFAAILCAMNASAWSYKSAANSWKASTSGFTTVTMNSGKSVSVVMLKDVGDGVNICQNDDGGGQCLYCKWTKTSGDIFRGTARWNNGLYSDETVVVPGGKVYITVGSGTQVQMTAGANYKYTADVTFSTTGQSYTISGGTVSGATIKNENSMPNGGKPASLTMNNSYISKTTGNVHVEFDLRTNKVTETAESAPEPEPEPEQTVTLYFVNHPEWTNLKAHVWDNNSTPYKDWNNSESMTDTGEDKDGYDVYSYTFPSKYTNIIFKGDGQQTQDNVAAYDVAKPYFCDDEWYASLAEIPALGAVVTYDYYVIGTVNSWTLKDANFGMTDDNADGVYEKVVTLADGKNQMKINNGTWGKQAGYDQLNAQYEGVSRGTSGDDNNIIINIATGKDITVKFDKNANKITLDGLTETVPEPEPTELTYNVTVPAGTKACYICGDMTGWNFNEMTKVDDTHYTITIAGAKKSDGYKYASGGEWGYVEKDASGNEIGNRTYVAGNDVVASWASVYDPDAVEQELTYSVTVPEGTYACYIAMDTDPAQDGWEFNEMTKVDETHYTYVRTGLKNKTYKYTSGPSWEYVEKTAEDGEVADRQWAENDVVAKWTSVYNPTAPTYDYYLTGSLVGGWDVKQQGIEKDGELYKVTFNALAAGTYEFKITAGDWEHQWNYNNLGAAYEEVSQGVDGEGNPNENIKITLAAEAEKEITVIFDATAGKITFEGLTPYVAPLTYTVTVPAGTEKCYIAGAFAQSNWNTFVEMTKVGDEDKFTIEIVGAKETDEYKYACQADWAYAEVIDGGGNRTAWTELDEVTAWNKPVVYTYYLMGVDGDWTTGIEMEVNTDAENEVMLTCQPVNGEVKIKRLGDDASEYWYGGKSLKEDAGNLGTNTEAATDGDGNIALEEGIYNFYFNTADGKLWIAAATGCETEIRTGLTAGNYYTICMKQKMKKIQGATLWSFYGKDTNFAYLVQEKAPYAAGKAYVMYAEAETVSAILTGGEATDPVANGAIHGTFDLMVQGDLDAAGNNIYLVIDNQLRRVDGQTGNSLPAYRAYVDIDEIITGGAPAGIPANRVRSMPMQPQVATGMENVDASAQPVKTIINGQLFILRGEKMYDAQGKLVK